MDIGIAQGSALASPGSRPRVSVVMANRNGERHLAAAIRSVLGQSIADLELLLVDDASTDGSAVLAEALAAADPRLRVIRLVSNGGPAAARNRALEAARGEWIAVADSDDILHPERLARLLAAAERDGADIVADDMLAFQDDDSAPPRRLFARRLAGGPAWIGAAEFALANRLFGKAEPLGYLKPLFRADLLERHGVRYDERLRIAEDYDLLMRLLLRGARFRLVPELTYFYRRHRGSISHRLAGPDIAAMLEADARLRQAAGLLHDTAARVALDRRLASIHRAQALAGLLEGLRQRDAKAVVRHLRRAPSAAWLLAKFTGGDRLRRLFGGLLRRPAPPRDARPAVCLLSRQRIRAGTNGSSDYLLGICRALKAAGFAIHLVSPTPATLGRMAVMRLGDERQVFDSIAIRGTWRLGDRILARDPRVWIQAALGVADRLARRAGIQVLSRFARPAPYSVALPWAPEDFLYVAAKARPHADAVLADYAFLTAGIPYALRPESPSAVVMHDLFSSRPAAFAAIGAADSVATPTLEEEAAMLAGADTVIAIQAEEAAVVRAALPADRRVVVAPMAVEAVPDPQPGEGAGLLFVGSAVPANIDGLRWFLAEVFPRIRAARPGTRLRVVGTVGGAVAGPGLPEGVDLLGRVPDLAGPYRAADVVVSPLRAGSGLKVKLVEALAHGKAMVATGVTAQGVRAEVEGALILADEAAAFADAVLHLLEDEAARRALAAAALAAAGRHFSAEAAYGGLAAWLRQPRPAPARLPACAG